MHAFTRRWVQRIASGIVAGLTAFGFVWLLLRVRGIPDPYYFRMLLAGGLAGVVGILGRMFADEVLRQ